MRHPDGTASVTADSVRGEQVRITASSENVSERNNTFHQLNVNDETRGYIPDKLSEFPVPETQSDRKSHAHHNFSTTFFNTILK